MALSVRKLHPLFAAEIAGIDVSRPLDEDTRFGIERAMDEHAVVVLRDQPLDDAAQIAFTGLYGPLELAPPVRGKTGTFIDGARIRHREIFDVSNLDENGKLLDPDDQRRAYGE